VTTRRTTTKRGRQLSVNNDRCRRYGFCVAEAPDLFQLAVTGELRYRRAVADNQVDQARAAVRSCPMLAIALSDER
jgi:ferredoxin